MPNPSPWTRFTLADVAPACAGPAGGPAASPLVRSPSWDDLRAGLYHPRPRVFSDLWRAFQAWCHDEGPATADGEKLRVFVIEGRAGDGKSVLLRQLMATCLRERLTPDVDWLEPAANGESFHAPPPTDLDIVFVDELPGVVDGALGHRWISQVCAKGAVALVTTSRAGLRRELRGRFGGLLEFTAWTLPEFSRDEAEQLAAWAARRDGGAARATDRWREGMVLSEFLFTLRHGKTVAELLPELRLALGKLGLGGRAKFVWLANALGWSVPAALLESEAARSHARSLAEKNIVPLEIEADGLRFAPPALAWEIALHWAGNPRDWRLQWVEALQFALRAWEGAGDAHMPSRLLRGLLEAGGLANGGGPREASAYGTVSRRELVRELYRAHRRDFAGDPAPAAVAGWLALNEELALMLLPDPVECAAKVFRLAGCGREEARTPALAAATWIAADCRRAPVGPEVRRAVELYFATAGGAEGVGRALAKIVRVSRKSAAEARRMAGAWLGRFSAHPEAESVRVAMARAMVASDATDGSDRPAAPDPAQDDEPIPALSPRAKKKRAEDAWLHLHRKDPEAGPVLVRRLAEDGRDGALRETALRWLEANAAHPASVEVMGVLAREPDTETMAVAGAWCDARGRMGGPPAELLASLIAARPTSAEWRERGEAFVRNPGRPARERVSAVLLGLGGARAEDVRMALALNETLGSSARSFLSAALGEALARNPERAVEVFRDVVAKNREASLVRAVAYGLTKVSPAEAAGFVRRVTPTLAPASSARILHTLLCQASEAPEVLEATFAWLARNHRAHGYGWLMKALSSHPQAKEYLAEHREVDERVRADFATFRPGRALFEPGENEDAPDAESGLAAKLDLPEALPGGRAFPGASHPGFRG